MQRIRLNSDWTRIAVVHQPTIKVHSLLRYPQRKSSWNNFASSRDLEKTSDGLYEIFQHRTEPLRSYIAHLNQKKVAIPECSIPTAIYAFKRGLLPDGNLYKELTKYQCKTMEDVMSRAWAKVRPQGGQTGTNRAIRETLSMTSQGFWEQKPGRYQNRPIEKAERMAVSTGSDISHLYI